VKLLILVLLAVAILGALGTVVLLPAPVLADSRTPAEATAHAREELANCRAQQRLECPTETPTPTLTATAIATSTPLPTPTPEPTEEPTVTPTATPASCWLTDQDLGDPSSGYVVFDEAGVPVPCPTLALSDVAIDEPIVTPTLDPTPDPSPTPRPTPTPRSAPPAPASPPQVEVRTIVQTVVVVVTVAPTETPVPAATATSQPTRTPTASPTPTRAPTITPTATVSLPAAVATPTRGTLQAAPAPRATNSAPGQWDWGGFARTAAMVVAAVLGAAWLLTRRTVARWGTRPDHVEDTHA